MKAFSQRLKTLRKTAGLTLKQLALRLEVSEAYVSMLESGKRQPARMLVARLAEALGGQPDSPLHDELLILAGYSPENLKRFETPQDPLAAYQQALLATPEDFLLFQGYVQTLIKTGRMPEALAQIDQGFRRFRDAFQLQCLLADLELARGNLPAALVAQKAAIEQFRQADLDDRRLGALLIANLGGICFQLGMQQLGSERLEAQACFIQAEAHFAAALELDSDNLFTRDEYARVCFNLADLETGEAAQAHWHKSLEAFAAVMAADPKPGLSEAALRESALFWAYAQAKCGQFVQARQLLQLMASLSPQDWFSRYLLAAVDVLEYARTAQKEVLAAAAIGFRRSLALNPSQTLTTAAHDPDLAPLRQHHPDLFSSTSTQEPSS